MLKRLKVTFAPSQSQRFLEKYQINREHTLIPSRAFTEIRTLLKRQKNKEQMIKCLYTKLNSADSTLKLKTMVLIHGNIRNNFDERVCQLINGKDIPEKIQQNNPKKFKLKVLQEVEIKNYMEVKVVGFYLRYLKKIIAYQESYEFVRDYSWKKHYTNIQLINHGFKVINLMNFIIESQEMFNKMGRYYQHFNEIFNMFLMFLQDIQYFNHYIKKTIKKLLQETQQKSKKNNLENIQVQINEKNAQQTKHIFLYLNQSQKISDQLYQFYYNRYYYKRARGFLTFPTFLTIESQQYDKVKSQTKKIDPNLVYMMKKSKYDRKGSYSLSKTVKTQGNMNKSYSGNNKQFFKTEQNSRNFYGNITMDFIEDRIEKVFEENDE